MHKVSTAFCALLLLGSGRLTRERLAEFSSLLQALNLSSIFVKKPSEGVFVRP